MSEHSDNCHKESEIRAAYPEHSTAHFEEFLEITVNSNSEVPPGKQNGNKEAGQANPLN